MPKLFYVVNVVNNDINVVNNIINVANIVSNVVDNVINNVMCGKNTTFEAVYCAKHQELLRRSLGNLAKEQLCYQKNNVEKSKIIIIESGL